jgi:hypothetical protein
MTVKLHRCTGTWLKGPHPCWQVQKALDESGIQYEVVKHPAFPRGRRTELVALTGQNRLPVLQFEDGRVLREESKELAARIREGRLEEGSAAARERPTA